MWFVYILKFICIGALIFCGLAYVNNIIVDIGSAIASSRTLSPTGADDAEKSGQYAAFRINLSLIMAIAGGILVCLP